MASGDPRKPHVLVLGGGLAGLSVALAVLGQKPCRVTILEKASRPGGMAISLHPGGMTSDLGPHRIYTAIDEMRRWFQDEIGDEMYEVRRVSRMYMCGRYIGYPPSAGELLAALGPAALATMAGGYLWARARVLAGGLRGDSFGHTMEKAFGRPLCDRLVFPYIRKVWRTDPYRMSGDIARARATSGGLAGMALRALAPGSGENQGRSLKKFHYVRGGIETLVRRLVNRVEARGAKIICGADVRRLTLERGNISSVDYREESGRDASLSADFVFSTIPLPDLVGALEGEWGGRTQAADAAAGLIFLNTFFTFAVVGRPAIGEDHWLYYPEAAPCVNRAYEPKNFDPALAPPDRTMLCMERTTLPGEPDWSRADKELGEECVSEIAATGLFGAGEVLGVHTHRLEKSYPLYSLDHSARLESIVRALAGVENLITLGRQGLFLHNNMDHSIYMGLRAAECWARGDAPVARWYRDEIRRFRDFTIVD